MTLDKCRNQSEIGLKILAERRKDTGTHLVVLVDVDGRWHCHQYFFLPESASQWKLSYKEVEAIEGWHLSVDLITDNLEAMVNWALKPGSRK